MSYIAEQNIIGCLLVDNDCISEIYHLLEPQMFTYELFGRMYHEFQKAYDNHYDINIPVLIQKLQDENFPSDLVAREIKECTDSYLTSATIKATANAIVQEHKVKVLDKFLSSIHLSPNNIDDVVRQLAEEVDIISGQKQTKSKTLAEIALENKSQYFTEKIVPEIHIGFNRLDDMLGGLEGGDMIVIGARPAVGKSAFVTQITSYLAKQGKRIGFYNLEMQNKQVYERFVVSESGISLTRLRRAITFLGDEQNRFNKANEVLESRNNIVITTGSKTVSEIRAESLHMDYDIIIIDYLQLLKSDNSYRGNRTAEVGAISKAIKSLAMELNIPIIALSQLNRCSEARDTKEPTMADLREAGDIEQDASVIILIWNINADDKSKKGCKVEKNRQGETGKIGMIFNGDLMKFEESNQDNFSKGFAQTDESPFD